jgi:hypothetical protein
MIRQSIADRTGYRFEGGGPDGDLFTFLTELTVAMVRENSADPQTVMQSWRIWRHSLWRVISYTRPVHGASDT